jgi:hypothetical protein
MIPSIYAWFTHDIQNERNKYARQYHELRCVFYLICENEIDLRMTPFITVFTRGVARNLIYALYSTLHMIPLIAFHLRIILIFIGLCTVRLIRNFQQKPAWYAANIFYPWYPVFTQDLRVLEFCLRNKYAFLFHLRIQIGLLTLRLIHIIFYLRMIPRIYRGFTQWGFYLRMIRGNRSDLRIITQTWFYLCMIRRSYAEYTHDTWTA